MGPDVRAIAERIVAADVQREQPRNLLRNPSSWNLDFGLRKSVPISGNYRIEFPMEAFNVLNHPNWNNAANNPTSGSFGFVTQKNGERVIQLATKYTS